MLFVCITSPIKTGPADTKISTSFAGIADLLFVLAYFEFALNVAFFVRHEYLLHPKSGILQEVPRESVHIYGSYTDQRQLKLYILVSLKALTLQSLESLRWCYHAQRI